MPLPNVLPKVKHILAAECIGDEELEHMLRHAAITSIEGFNRRFHHWLFLVRDKELRDMRYSELLSEGYDQGWGYDVELCEHCGGHGCQSCGWVGEYLRWRFPSTDHCN